MFELKMTGDDQLGIGQLLTVFKVECACSIYLSDLVGATRSKHKLVTHSLCTPCIVESHQVTNLVGGRLMTCIKVLLLGSLGFVNVGLCL